MYVWVCIYVETIGTSKYVQTYSYNRHLLYITQQVYMFKYMSINSFIYVWIYGCAYTCNAQGAKVL